MFKINQKLITLFLPFLLICGCQYPKPAKEPIKISINVWPGYAIAYLAQEKGFFKQNGVEVELILKKVPLNLCSFLKKEKLTVVLIFCLIL